MLLRNALALGSRAAASSRRAASGMADHADPVRCASPALRATVFGAYGFVGNYVVDRLAADGIQCIVPWRGDDMEWRHLKVNGDLGIVVPRPYSPKDKDSIRRCIEGSDIVINLCGKVSGLIRAVGPSGFRPNKPTDFCPPPPLFLPPET